MTTETFDIYNATAQEACDYAVKKIVAQGKRCMVETGPNEGFNCCYDDGQGNHCAFGWLLTDDMMAKYGKVFDDIPAASLVERMYDDDYKVPEIFITHMSELQELQGFHDMRTASHRATVRRALKRAYNINTDGEHWQQWVDMGEDDE